MFRKIRIALAAIFFVLITLMFLDFTGTLHEYLGWMAKVQFLPAIMALNIAVIAGLLLLTLIFGRVYCSVICPLGVLQDVVSWIAGKRKKNRFRYSKAKTILRYIVLALFVLAFISGVSSIVALIAPYSSYGRIVQNLFSPIYLLGNNLLSYIDERLSTYNFYSVDIWIKSAVTFGIAAVSFVAVAILAWRNGRTYCNTICPVGTVLGFFARFSFLKPVIDTTKCNGCSLCSRRCKASCINAKEHKIDYSRCVACMDCIDNCRQGAISYKHVSYKKVKEPAAASANEEDGNTRRKFLTVTTMIAATAAVNAQKMKVDGGLATIADKKVPKRNNKIVPAGAISLNNLNTRCTACQLCVSACPNEVLRPSGNILTLMQPEASYERGYCRPECNKCSEVCPTGAIKPISLADKSSTQVGHAVWIKKNCVVHTDGVSCGNCARHCPNGAIMMIAEDPGNPDSKKFPVIDTERCIGCGACEYLCPARPFSAIYVEGHPIHKSI